MNLSAPQSKYCQFTDLKNGVWKFFFVEASNRAVDEWYDWQSYIKATGSVGNEQPICMLLDMRKSGALPLLYSLQQGRDWRKKYPNINSYEVKIALLLKPFPRYQQPYIKLIKDGVNIFTLEQVKIDLFFEEEQTAIKWLLGK